MTEITNDIINQGQFIPHLKEGDFLPVLLNAIKSAPHLPTDNGRKLNFSWELYI